MQINLEVLNEQKADKLHSYLQKQLVKKVFRKMHKYKTLKVKNREIKNLQIVHKFRKKIVLTAWKDHCIKTKEHRFSKSNLSNQTFRAPRSCQRRIRKRRFSKSKNLNKSFSQLEFKNKMSTEGHIISKDPNLSVTFAAKKRLKKSTKMSKAKRHFQKATISRCFDVLKLSKSPTEN